MKTGGDRAWDAWPCRPAAPPENLRRRCDLRPCPHRGGGAGQRQARVAVAPAWQGRVLTSTTAGERGASYGWINRPLIASGKTLPHMTPYGGEDRLWLGPEGGQFSIFFKKGDPFEFKHWQTPAALDTEAWTVAAKDATKVSVARAMRLTNHAGTTFDLRVERTGAVARSRQRGRELRPAGPPGPGLGRVPVGESPGEQRPSRPGRGRRACCRSGSWGCSTPRRRPSWWCRPIRARW